MGLHWGGRGGRARLGRALRRGRARRADRLGRLRAAPVAGLGALPLDGLGPKDRVGQSGGVVAEIACVPLPVAHGRGRPGGGELGDGLSAILAAHMRSSVRTGSTSVGRKRIERVVNAGIRCSSPASRVRFQSVSSVRTTVVAGRSAST